MNTKKTNIIWDLSGTLLKPSAAHLSEQEIADYSLVFYLWSGKKEQSPIDSLALDVLNLLGEQEGVPEDEIIRLHTGDPVPTIIADYVGGKYTSLEAWDHVSAAFSAWKNKHLHHEADFAQIERTLKAFFTPEVLASCMEPIRESFELLQELAARHPKDAFYVLSNWDTESFVFIYKKFKNSLFTYFPKEHIVISGHAKSLKPHPAIYRYFLSHTELDPHTCFFIDDQKENLEGAARMGIDGALFRPELINKLRAKLITIALL